MARGARSIDCSGMMNMRISRPATVEVCGELSAQGIADFINSVKSLDTEKARQARLSLIEGNKDFFDERYWQVVEIHGLPTMVRR